MRNQENIIPLPPYCLGESRKVGVKVSLPREYSYFRLMSRIEQLSGPAMTPSASSFVQSISSEDFASAEEFVENKVLFEYTATSEFELGVHGW